jgi:hypothetical protein
MNWMAARGRLLSDGRVVGRRGADFRVLCVLVLAGFQFSIEILQVPHCQKRWKWVSNLVIPPHRHIHTPFSSPPTGLPPHHMTKWTENLVAGRKFSLVCITFLFVFDGHVSSDRISLFMSYNIHSISNRWPASPFVTISINKQPTRVGKNMKKGGTAGPVKHQQKERVRH